MHIVFWLENPKVRDHSEDVVIDGKIILECFLGRYGGKVCIGCFSIRIVAGSCEDDNKPSGCIEFG
jgi:hypothetical protein